MKSKFLTSILLLALCSQALAQGILPNRRNNFQPAAVGGGTVYLVAEDFSSLTASNTWTMNAAQDWLYATAPAPLQGSYSWKTAALAGEAYTNFTATSDVWMYAQMNISVLADQIDIFQLRDSSGTGQSKLRIMADGSIRFLHFATTPYTATGIVTAGTTFHIWMHYYKGTGANSGGELFVSSSGTKPGSANLTITGEGATANVSRVVIMGWSGANYIVDKVRVSTNSIGSNPN